MCRKDKERVIRVLAILDDMRQHMSNKTCKLTTLMAESDVPGYESIMHDLSNALEHITGALIMSRYRIIGNFNSQYPTSSLLETGDDDCLGQIDPNW